MNTLYVRQTAQSLVCRVRWVVGSADSYRTQTIGSVRRVTPWAHHGLQRSGTNLTNLRLQSVGLRPINAIDLRGDNPRSKHFRWQTDKSSIPPFIRDTYANTIVVNNLLELNRSARFPDNCRHVVVKKLELDWLSSISNWGISCGWFDDVSEALKQLPLLQRDYEQYYEFWEELATSNPERVIVLSFESFLSEFENSLKKLVGLDLSYDETVLAEVEIERVPQSPELRKKYVTAEIVGRALGETS